MRQRVDLFEANFSANKISLGRGQSYIMERIYHNGSFNVINQEKLTS